MTLWHDAMKDLSGMRPVLVFGAGPHGHITAETLRECGLEVRGFLDDRPPQGVEAYRPEAIEHPSEYPVYVAIGNPIARKAVVERLTRMGFVFGPGIAHPTAYVAKSAIIGEGTVVLPQAMVHTGAKVGRHCVVNVRSTVHHDAEVEDYASICPQAQVCGRCLVGEGAFLALGATLLLRRTMGEWSILGADSTAHRDVPARTMSIGNPARIMGPVDEDTWRRCF